MIYLFCPQRSRLKGHRVLANFALFTTMISLTALATISFYRIAIAVILSA